MINSRNHHFREEQETFEYPNMTGKGPKIRQIGNMYAKLIDIEDDLPKGINKEDYLAAKRALKKMWLSVSGRTATDIKNNVYRTEDGDFPKEGSFITCTHRYIWKDRRYDWPTEREEVTGMEGLHMDFDYDYLHSDRDPVDKDGRYDYVEICFVEGEHVHQFKCYPEIDYLVEGKVFPVKDLLRWRYDTEKDFNKVPRKMLDKIASKIY